MLFCFKLHNLSRTFSADLLQCLLLCAFCLMEELLLYQELVQTQRHPYAHYNSWAEVSVVAQILHLLITLRKGDPFLHHSSVVRPAVAHPKRALSAVFYGNWALVHLLIFHTTRFTCKTK